MLTCISWTLLIVIAVGIDFSYARRKTWYRNGSSSVINKGSIVYCNSTGSGNKGFLLSPNYPYHYPANVLCYYRIEAPIGRRIVLTFPYFHLEDPPCKYDFVKIYDGSTPRSELLELMCGTNNPRKVTSSRHQLILVFVSDEGIQTRGFNIKYVTSDVYSDVARQSLPACGRPKVSSHDVGRITHGKEVKAGQSPWYVLIREISKRTTICGGSLINSEWVIAAAHCVRNFETFFNYPFNVNAADFYFGTHQCNGNRGIRRRLKRFIVHPDYYSYQNDLVLFQLDKPVVYTDLILPVCLERERVANKLLVEGRSGIVTGCGTLNERGRQPTTLREVSIPYVTRNVCRKKAERWNMTLISGMFCAGYSFANRGDACQGDSGGPFVMKDRGRWVLMGVVSWGVGCDRVGEYGYYTHISHYYDWIKAVISS